MQKTGNIGRTRLTDREKKALLKRWTRSGEPARVFAARTGVGMSTLFKWRRQIGVQPRAKATVRKPGVAHNFIPVRLRQTRGEGAVRITGPHGFAIEVDEDTNEAALRLAVRAIAACG